MAQQKVDIQYECRAWYTVFSIQHKLTGTQNGLAGQWHIYQLYLTLIQEQLWEDMFDQEEQKPEERMRKEVLQVQYINQLADRQSTVLDKYGRLLTVRSVLMVGVLL